MSTKWKRRSNGRLSSGDLMAMKEPTHASLGDMQTQLADEKDRLRAEKQELLAKQEMWEKGKDVKLKTVKQETPSLPPPNPEMAAYNPPIAMPIRVAELPKFPSDNLTIKQFLTQFDRLAAVNAWTPAMQLLILPTCLKGRALTYFDSLDPPRKASMEQLR